MNKEKLLEEIVELPKIETNNPIITMNSITVDDLMSVIDRLNKVPDYNDLLKENQELKKQLENCYCNRTDCSGRIKDSKKYDSLIQAQEVQQKEFIKFLENELLHARYYARDIAHYIEYVLRKYKKLIGVSDEKEN
jgi:hypothetical protein